LKIKGVLRSEAKQKGRQSDGTKEDSRSSKRGRMQAEHAFMYSFGSPSYYRQEIAGEENR
jgi:hypothetical protein